MPLLQVAVGLRPSGARVSETNAVSLGTVKPYINTIAYRTLLYTATGSTMSTNSSSETCHDPFHLERFLDAQAPTYDRALTELRNGRKRTHWMWFIFPQLDGLGASSTAKYYAIRGLDEARAYREHPILGPRLVACAQAVLELEGRSARQVFGTPDDLKLRSCATLFQQISPPDSVFARLLEKYFSGKSDLRTLQLLGGEPDDRPAVETTS